MNSAEFLRRIDDICTWKRDDRRAPHKPLMLLLALGRVHAGEDRMVRFRGVEDKLDGLLRRFGPRRLSHSPQDPFWRLQKDRLWEVPGWEELPKLVDEVRPQLPALRRARGGFPEPMHELLCADPALVIEAAQRILDSHFPRSQHAEILDEVGLPEYLVLGRTDALGRMGALGRTDAVAKKVAEGAAADWPRQRRGRRFRELVLQAYRGRCAVCGHDGRLSGRLLGLDAAHIKWPGAGGPDCVSNGLALCAFHRTALDSGKMGLERTDAGDTAVRVSRGVSGRSAGTAQLLDHRGEPLRRPRDSGLEPDAQFVQWHWEEVFRRPAWGW